MSVANVSDASQRLAQYFQRLAADRAQQPASGDGATSAPDAQSTASSAKPHHHHGGGSQGGGAMRGKIESAVTSALQNYSGDGDVHQVIQDAIKTAISGGDSSTTAAPTDAATSAQQSSDAFHQLLASNGVDASSFRDDMMSAFKSAKGTETASSGAVTALPAGSYVDAEG